MSRSSGVFLLYRPAVSQMRLATFEGSTSHLSLLLLDDLLLVFGMLALCSMSHYCDVQQSLHSSLDCSFALSDMSCLAESGIMRRRTFSHKER